MEKDEVVICKGCGVKIEGKVAYYKVGKPSTLYYLCKRVCQYTKKSQKTDLCANPMFNKDTEYENTYFEPPTIGIKEIISKSISGFDRD